MSQIYFISAGPARQCGKEPMGMACMHGMECDGETMPSIEYTQCSEQCQCEYTGLGVSFQRVRRVQCEKYGKEPQQW